MHQTFKKVEKTDSLCLKYTNFNESFVQKREEAVFMKDNVFLPHHMKGKQSDSSRSSVCLDYGECWEE